MKGQGVLAGMPDLILFEKAHDYGALCIEMKSAKGRVTLHQGVMHERLTASGYCVRVCRSFDDFKTVILWYLDGIPCPLKGS